MSLVLAFGGVYRMAGGRPLGWTYDGAVNPSNLQKSWSPETAKENTVMIFKDGSFSITPKMSTEKVIGQVLYKLPLCFAVYRHDFMFSLLRNHT